MMDKNEYLKLSNLYKKYFEIFLLSKVDLVNYDNLITYSDCDFGNIISNVKLKSNLEEFTGTNHIYILNNFYIDKLNEEQIELLKSNNEEEIINLIKDTYKEIITYNKNNSSKRIKINYTFSTSKDTFFDNDSLVIAIYYGSNTKKYNTKDNYIKNYINKKEYLNEISSRIKKDINKALGIKCEVIYKKI